MNLSIATIAIGSIALVPTHIVDVFQPAYVKPVWLDGEALQTFVAPTDRLSSIGFFFLIPDEFESSANAELRLYHNDSSKPIRRASVRLRRRLEIPQHILHPTYFNFPPVADSNGKEFGAKVTISKAGIAMMNSETDSYARGLSYVSGTLQPSDFAFSIRHNGTLIERLNRLSRWAPVWLMFPLFVLLLTMALMSARSAARLLGQASQGQG